MVHAIKLTKIMYYIHVKCVAESDLSEIGHQGVKFRTDLLTVGLTILIKSQFTYQSTLLSAIHLHMIMTTYLVHNHLKVVSLLKSIFVTSKILIILSYKISSKDTYLEMIAPLLYLHNKRTIIACREFRTRKQLFCGFFSQC